MKLTSAAIALIAIASAIFWYFNSQTGPAASQGAAHAACPQCDQLSEQINSLQRNLQALKSQLQAKQGEPAAAAKVPPPGTPGADPAAVEAVRAADDARNREYMVGVAQSFANERVDANWAGRASQQVKTTLETDETLRSLARNVECRAQTCRVELQDDGSGKLTARLPLLAMGVADVMPTISAERVDQGNGRSAMVLYLSTQRPAPPTAGAR